MKKIIAYIIILIFCAFLGLYFFVFSNVSIPALNDLSAYIESTSTRSIIQRVEKKISALPPILNLNGYSNSNLTADGILSETNRQRKENGSLPPLSRNSKLDQVASLRIKDMFDKGYFEHKSPSGIGASDIAGDIGYEYILIGENIALGNFKDDKALVQAWMDSPGHRANILNRRYAEIGIGALKGKYNGKEVWLSVQIFGRPLSFCDEPDKSLKQAIDKGENAINLLDMKAKAQYAEINLLKSAGIKNVNDYNEKIRQYNETVNQIKNKESALKIQIENYNSQVKDFNGCVKG